MHWNYRLVNVPSEAKGEDWFELKEVFYNDDGSLSGYAPACIGGETLDEARHVFNKYIFEGVGKPALHEDDFKSASFKGEEDVYANACDDENCECRSSALWPDNIRNGCPNSITNEG
jgi:hypothetical protein